MRKFVAAIILAVTVGAVPAATASAATRWDCTVYLYKPTTFFLRGNWRPKTIPHGETVETWFDHCSGRFRPQKKSPNQGPGHWGVNIRLNVKNCTFTADEAFIRSSAGWKNARIYISPYPA